MSILGTFSGTSPNRLHTNIIARLLVYEFDACIRLSTSAHRFIATTYIDDLGAGNALAFASTAPRSSLHSVHIHIPTMHLNYVCNGNYTHVTAPTIQNKMILED